MKIFKEDSKIEIALQKVEILMNELGLKIDCGGEITVRLHQHEQEGRIMYLDTREISQQLPRIVDSERLVWIE